MRLPNHLPPLGAPKPRFTGKALPDLPRVKGDGMGPLSGQFDPPPRTFACAQAVNGIPDGQLFWIIQNGSPGTSMPGFNALHEDQIWQLVMYLRAPAK